jgi:hypothetical protein
MASDTVCCKCWCEFNDSLGACPLCDVPACHEDCVKCSEAASQKRFTMAQVMLDEQPFVGSDN